MFIEIIKEILIMFILIFGIYNIARYIIEKIYKKEVVNDNKGTVPTLIIFGFIVLISFDFLDNFPSINSLNITISKVILFVVILLTSSSILDFWTHFEKLIEDKVIIKIMFDDKPSHDKPNDNNPFYYCQLKKTSSCKIITGDRNTKKFFKKLIGKKYNISVIQNHYYYVNNNLEMELFESNEEIRKYISNSILSSGYFIRIKDSEISSIEKSFIDNILD